MLFNIAYCFCWKDIALVSCQGSWFPVLPQVRRFFGRWWRRGAGRRPLLVYAWKGARGDGVFGGGGRDVSISSFVFVLGAKEGGRKQPPPPHHSVIHVNFHVFIFWAVLAAARLVREWRGRGELEVAAAFQSVLGEGGRKGAGLRSPFGGWLQLGDGYKIHRGAGSQFLCRLHVCFHLFQVPLELGPAILKPRYHLGIGQTQLLGDLVSVRGGQIFLIQKPLFQFVDLVVCKGCSRLSPFLGSLSLAKYCHPIPSCK